MNRRELFSTAAACAGAMSGPRWRPAIEINDTEFFGGSVSFQNSNQFLPHATEPVRTGPSTLTISVKGGDRWFSDAVGRLERGEVQTATLRFGERLFSVAAPAVAVERVDGEMSITWIQDGELLKEVS